MRLRLRKTLRQHRQSELEQQYNPINLDYIFEEDDPLAPWLEERETPVFDPNDTSWLEEGGDGDDSGTDDDPLAGSSTAVPIRLRDNDDDNDDDDDDDGDGDGDGGDDDDDDDDGSGACPPGFGWADTVGGHDYFPPSGASTPLYRQHSGAFGTSGRGASGSGGAGGHHVKGKNIVQDADQCDIGQIGGDMSSLYLHNHNYEHVHYPLPMPSQETQDSSIDSSGYSMDQGTRYGDYGQVDMASQLATSLFGGNYGHYQQQSEQSEESSYHLEPSRKSFWW